LAIDDKEVFVTASADREVPDPVAVAAVQERSPVGLPFVE